MDAEENLMKLKIMFDKKVYTQNDALTDRQTDRQTRVSRRFISSLLVIWVIGVCVCGYKLYMHEKWQSQEIHRVMEANNELRKTLIKYTDLQGKQTDDIKYLSDKVVSLQSEIDKLKRRDSIWLDNGYNYLAIGNSITSHPLADYWWNENIGMAATSEDKDYVHLLGKWLKDNKKEEVMFQAYNFYIWEVQSKDRAETLNLLDSYLSETLDLITIQLSENAVDIVTFETDYMELFRYVHNKAPYAQIIVIDDFWDKWDKAAMKERAAKVCGVDFVSLDSIKENGYYQAGKGAVVYDKAGNAHTIEHDGVAMHPGDKGMAYIAEAVEKVIK